MTRENESSFTTNTVSGGALLCCGVFKAWKESERGTSGVLARLITWLITKAIERLQITRRSIDRALILILPFCLRLVRFLASAPLSHLVSISISPHFFLFFFRPRDLIDGVELWARSVPCRSLPGVIATIFDFFFSRDLKKKTRRRKNFSPRGVIARKEHERKLIVVNWIKKYIYVYIYIYRWRLIRRVL